MKTITGAGVRRSAANGGAGLRLVGRTVPVLVGEVMTRKVYLLRPDLSIESAAWLLLQRALSGAPVVDATDELVGFLSMTDLVRERHEHGDTDEAVTDPVLEAGFHSTRISRATVGEVMNLNVLALPPECTLTRAAALMAHDGIHRVPIVSRDRRVVGMLSSLDVLAWLGRRENAERRKLEPPARWTH